MQTEARRCLEDSLLPSGHPRLTTAKAVELVNAKPPIFQIAILIACVEWLPNLRENVSAKVVCAAASFLRNVPRSIAWELLQKLRSMAPSKENWIRDLVEASDRNN